MSGDTPNGIPFAARHIGPNPDEQRRMLEAVGYGSVEELMDAAIPEVIRWHGTLDLPPAASSAAVAAPADTGAEEAGRPSVFNPYYGTDAPPAANKGRKKPFVLDPLLND